ncbi:phage holin family protein [Shewanella sp. SM69]|uniref:phage holin family protein n=1 Tax=Shewanella TaxID=22 RepID=UPI0021DB2554|nr:phage holin family protein [Shewanella sp. SM69]MCU8036951.1 phage holin family protein [Shewanella sp. SM69]
MNTDNNLSSLSDYFIQKLLSMFAYFSSFVSALGGFLSVDKFAVILGMALAIATYWANKTYSNNKEKREAKLAEQQERINKLNEEIALRQLDKLNKNG